MRRGCTTCKSPAPWPRRSCWGWSRACGSWICAPLPAASPPSWRPRCEGRACWYATSITQSVPKFSPRTWSAWPFPTPWYSRRRRSGWPSGFPAGSTGCWWMPPAPGRGCSGRRQPPWKTGAQSWWRCAPGGRPGFWTQRRSFWPPAGVWCTPPAPSPPKRMRGRWPRFWPAIRNLRLRSWTSPGSPPGMGQPGRGWSIPSASGPTSSVGRAITPPSSAKGPGRRLRRRLSPGRTGSRPPGRPSPGTWGFSFRQGRPWPSVQAGSGLRKSCRISPDSGFCGPAWSWASAGGSGSCRPTPWPSGSPKPAGPGTWTPWARRPPGTWQGRSFGAVPQAGLW